MMNNKIKEMLELHIKHEIDLLPKNQQKVLDYITNLQQELQITQEKWNKDKQWVECRTKEWLDYKSRIEKADWWLKEMLKQAKSDETKAIISGTLELLLNVRSDE